MNTAFFFFFFFLTGFGVLQCRKIGMDAGLDALLLSLVARLIDESVCMCVSVSLMMLIDQQVRAVMRI